MQLSISWVFVFWSYCRQETKESSGIFIPELPLIKWHWMERFVIKPDVSCSRWSRVEICCLRQNISAGGCTKLCTFADVDLKTPPGNLCLEFPTPTSWTLTQRKALVSPSWRGEQLIKCSNAYEWLIKASAALPVNQSTAFQHGYNEQLPLWSMMWFILFL